MGQQILVVVNSGQKRDMGNKSELGIITCSVNAA